MHIRKTTNYLMCFTEHLFLVCESAMEDLLRRKFLTTVLLLYKTAYKLLNKTAYKLLNKTAYKLLTFRGAFHNTREHKLR